MINNLVSMILESTEFANCNFLEFKVTSSHCWCFFSSDSLNHSRSYWWIKLIIINSAPLWYLSHGWRGLSWPISKWSIDFKWNNRSCTDCCYYKAHSDTTWHCSVLIVQCIMGFFCFVFTLKGFVQIFYCSIYTSLGLKQPVKADGRPLPEPNSGHTVKREFFLLTITKSCLSVCPLL